MRGRFLVGACAIALWANAIAGQQTPSLLGTPATQGDSLRLTRAAAVAMALARNPQLEVAREQTAQFRALQVQARAFPDPAVTASLDQQRGLFRSGAGGEKNIGAGISILTERRSGLALMLIPAVFEVGYLIGSQISLWSLVIPHHT